MPKIKNINFKRRIITAGLSALALAVLAPVASTYAWGPDRPTYKMATPSDHPTFNSITDNNVIGDERDFVRIAEVGGNDKYTNEIKITPGKTYEVYVFYHNNTASNLNASGKALARKVKVQTKFPSKVNASSKGTISATISASNTTPASVWDEAYVTTDSKADVELKYINATAILKNRGKADGTKLGTQIFSEGVYIGHDSIDGIIPGCSEYSGHIVYRLRAVQASSSVTKTASLDGKNFFNEVTAKPGDTVTYKITFKNGGSKDLTNVTFRDELPSGVTLVPGSVSLYDTGTKKTTKLSDNVVGKGINTGLFGENVSGTLIYQVKVNSDVLDDASCGTNSLKNVINVTTDQTGNQTASSVIKIEKVCDTPDPCKNDDGTIKQECCDQEEYKDLPQCKPKTVSELPETGPGEIALAIVAAVCVITGVSYWYRSQKEVAEIQSGIKANGHNSKSSKK